MRMAAPQVAPVSALPAARLTIQRKVRIGPVDDPLEREADRIAAAVVSGRPVGPVTGISSGTAQRKCAECEAEEKLQRKAAGTAEAGIRAEEEDKLQRKAAGTAVAATGEAPASVHAALRSPGQPLDAATRAYFEPRFGHDFGHVRVHTGPDAADAARAVNARAFTVGRNLVFGASQYAPRTREGQRLLAHELAHTLRQRALISRSPTTTETRSASDQLLPNKGKRPEGFLGWWLRHRVPAGFRVVTARRVWRAKRLLSGEFDLTAEERRLLLALVRRGRVEAAAETPEKGTPSLAEDEAGEKAAVAEAQPGSNEDGEEGEVGGEQGAEEDSPLNGPYSTPERAAHGFAKRYNPISKATNEEVCSIIVKKIVKQKEQFFFLDGWQATNAGERTHSCPANPPSASRTPHAEKFCGPASYARGGGSSLRKRASFAGGQEALPRTGRSVLPGDSVGSGQAVRAGPER